SWRCFAVRPSISASHARNIPCSIANPCQSIINRSTNRRINLTLIEPCFFLRPVRPFDPYQRNRSLEAIFSLASPGRRGGPDRGLDREGGVRVRVWSLPKAIGNEAPGQADERIRDVARIEPRPGAFHCAAGTSGPYPAR